MLLRKSNKGTQEKAPQEKPVKAAPVKKAAKEKPVKAPKQPKSVGPRPPKIAYKSDIFTMMLMISFLALLTACLFLYLNVSFDAQNM
ncbi:MAG: hypothetical protein FWC50_14055 [Planctomycetaceae bacterium]|nr:hypothetical protein [Planctomycetaceae bacterium]